MNRYVKEFLIRGFLFAGGGPLVLGIIFLILQHTLPAFALNGTEVFVGILSTYLLAFLHAGVSVFNSIEHWPLAKSLAFHFLTLYLAYTVCYLINAWIPFNPMVLLIFTIIFAVSYFLVWGIVYLCVRKASQRFNKQLKQ